MVIAFWECASLTSTLLSPQVKELPAYLAVAANTSGSTPKDLFEDVAEELQKQVNKLYLLISLRVLYSHFQA